MTLPGLPSPWKLATGVAGILSLVLISLLMSSYFEKRDLMDQRTELTRRIDDPETGYVAQLAQARTNVETLKVALAGQNKKYQDLSKESQARLAAAEARLTAAQAQTRVMERKLNSFLATKPQGDTLDARIRDIDQRFLQEFVQ